MSPRSAGAGPERDPFEVVRRPSAARLFGLVRDAEIAYRRAIARSPDMADAWFNLGVLTEKAGRDREALDAYERAFAADPAYVDALHNAALVHMRAGRFALAAGLLDRARAASPASVL